MIDIVYFSNTTEYTHRFVQKLEWEGETHRIPLRGREELNVTKPYVLICPSYGSETTGHVPPQVKRFLANETNRENCAAVIGTGNINFGVEYARSGDVISQKLEIPLLYRFELAGNTDDIVFVREVLKNFYETVKQTEKQKA